MTNKIELVVFDMAGTTVKDKNYVGIAFKSAMEFYGYPVRVEMVNQIMGYRKPVAIRMMLAQLAPDQEVITDDLVDRIHAVFKKEMLEFYRHTVELAALPNVEETFEILKEQGIKIALNTGFSRDIADVIIARLGWENKIDCLVASDEVDEGRPYPYMIQKIMKELGITSADNVAKVGDTEVDINEGRNAGCQFVIGITTGSFTKEELMPYNPTHIIDDIKDVVQIIAAGSMDYDENTIALNHIIQ